MTHKTYIPRMIAFLPEAVRAWRKERGMTQDQLAKKAGVSRVTVVRVEALESEDVNSVTLDTVNKLAKALGQAADKFVAFR